MHIDEIELYFSVFGFPNEDVEIFQGVYVLCVNAEFFVQSTLQCLRAHPLNKRFMPYYEHLLKYYQIAKQLNK